MKTLETKRDIIDKLRAAGVTPTQQRVDIAQILFIGPQHLSAEQVLRRANENGEVVSKATVYNTLNLFAEKGLIKEVIVDPTKVYYDSTVEHHHHIYNIDTGNLVDINAEEVPLNHLPELPMGTIADGVEVIIRVRNAPVN